MSQKQCKALKINKEQCSRMAQHNSEYCWQHRFSRSKNTHLYQNPLIQGLLALVAIAGLFFAIASCMSGAKESKQDAVLKNSQANHNEVMEALGISAEIKPAVDIVFSEILEEEDIPQWQWPEKLMAVAERHQKLLDEWTSFQSGDLEIDKLRAQARQQIEMGEYGKANQLLQQAVEIDQLAIKSQQEALDQRRLSIAQSLVNQADLAKTMLDYKGAIELYTKALEQLPPNEHASRSAMLCNLGWLNEKAANFVDAETNYKHALEIIENILGPDDPAVAYPLNNLAGLYCSQGRHTEADPLYLRSLRIREDALGPNHHIVATSLNNLGNVYRIKGQYAQAELLLQRALSIDEKALGLEHPDVAVTLNNLAVLYDTQGLYAQAEPPLTPNMGKRKKG